MKTTTARMVLEAAKRVAVEGIACNMAWRLEAERAGASGQVWDQFRAKLERLGYIEPVRVAGGGIRSRITEKAS